ncbi:hypothetical protein BLA17378_01496 [Burkholderia aenigmatica]|uniref:LigA n=1 Tax=Burkholderia aenigmatica TaxID=2015348 RepID=A0ABY6XRJ4_9BURK|nr:hypothetical protein BLA17378_01496 [Burkholderia aenigmatica]
MDRRGLRPGHREHREHARATGRGRCRNRGRGDRRRAARADPRRGVERVSYRADGARAVRVPRQRAVACAARRPVARGAAFVYGRFARSRDRARVSALRDGHDRAGPPCGGARCTRAGYLGRPAIAACADRVAEPVRQGRTALRGHVGSGRARDDRGADRRGRAAHAPLREIRRRDDRIPAAVARAAASDAASRQPFYSPTEKI